MQAKAEQVNAPIPSPSGTFAAHTSPRSNPKAAKEPASPSRPPHRDRVVLRLKKFIYLTKKKQWQPLTSGHT